MTTENIQLIKLTAADGMVLTDGTSYGKEVYLGINDTADRWTEIPESEVPEPDIPHIIDKTTGQSGLEVLLTRA